MSSAKPHLNLVVIGHVDHGKSTSVGHLLLLKGSISERAIREHDAEAQKYGMRIEEVKFAWVLDRLKEEIYGKTDRDLDNRTFHQTGHRDFGWKGPARIPGSH